ncbi:ParB/RepB/Spo0J family partition protein [Acidiphilium sp. PA]|uniref:ParB/RepB/Spo0J family partition protein n=1 Tax=Acidiphilium sp. PA TaxID=2871705 RepID=UPI0022448120|nr:ParB/RepB/Spo0J family partition protein [Acidiphilium sp. PA]MCW8309088.1 ParB/RepB/Spo0J family partition protein [Acidiphilium sp. PA]
MSKGNKGFGQFLADVVDTKGVPSVESPASGIMQNRTDSLHRIATGKIVTDRTEFVDPERCRPWANHNRDIDHLSPESCSDLIEAFKSAGRQRIPAIVRRLRDDPNHEYEIVAGVRRWWTVKWLRANHHPEYDYLITVQNLTDEEAFRVADLENRARKDISDMERARDYIRALEMFYSGSQTVMAERLNVSKSWMSRMLEVARLPTEVIIAFSDTHKITAKYASLIAPLIKSDPSTRDRVFDAANEIAKERSGGNKTLSAQDTLKRLLKAAEQRSVRTKTRTAEVRSAKGKQMIRYNVPESGRSIVLTLSRASGADKKEFLAAIDQILSDVMS